VGLDECKQALGDAAPFIFTSQELYYKDEIYKDGVARVRVLENVMGQVLYWRMNEEVNANRGE